MSFTGRICIPVMERLRDCAGVFFFFSAKRAFRAFACAHSFTAYVYMCGSPPRGLQPSTRGFTLERTAGAPRQL